MRRDRAGYYYFVDRAGDTFRWKGENVSTTEVASVVEACPGITEAVVFGVLVPGYEGRAGMAAITINKNFSAATLQAHLVENLPEYARPIFIRICRSLEVTGTFKLKKDILWQEGYATPTAPDIILFYDRQTCETIACDEQFRQLLLSGGTHTFNPHVAAVLGRIAGIHRHHGACDISGFVTKQKVDRICDILDICHPTECASTCDLSTMIRTQIIGHFSIDEAWCNRIDGNAQRAQLPCQGSREPCH